MGDRSAGHCGRHRNYRCHECETNHPDDYHGDGKEEKVMTDKSYEFENLKQEQSKLLVKCHEVLMRDEAITTGIVREHAQQKDRIASLEQAIKRIEDAVKEQAEDEGIWFAGETAPEAYLQQELRHLHSVIEDAAKMVGEV